MKTDELDLFIAQALEPKPGPLPPEDGKLVSAKGGWEYSYDATWTWKAREFHADPACTVMLLELMLGDGEYQCDISSGPDTIELHPRKFAQGCSKVIEDFEINHEVFDFRQAVARAFARMQGWKESK